MCAGSTIVKRNQLTIRREMDRRGFTMKAVAFDSGIPGPTLATYFPQDPLAEPAQIPGGAIYALCGVLPTDLLSLLMPDGFCIVRAPGAVDHDAIAGAVTEYMADKNAAHHPESECGPAIGPKECARLTSKIAHLPIARAV